MLYLDHAATTPVKPEVLRAVWPYLSEEFGNPSSVHETGLRAKAALDWARQTCAEVLGVDASEIVFTSGGSESNNLSIQGIALGSPRGRHIVSSGLEHSSVLAVLEFLERVHGFEVTLVEPTTDGSVAADALRAALRPDTTLVTLMAANNEIGAVNDIALLSAVAAEFGVPFHTDAVQTAGWLELPTANVQALSLSGHKFGAPKGSGLVYLSSGLQIEPHIHGGSQEGGLRAGTQNVAWAVGVAVALQLLPAPDSAAKVADVTGKFIADVLAEIPVARLTGPPPKTVAGERHPAIASFTFAGLNGETLLLDLENAGITCSSGSACAAGSTEPSHVLLSLGLEPDICRTAVRFSFGHEATAEQADLALAALKRATGRLG